MSDDPSIIRYLCDWISGCCYCCCSPTPECVILSGENFCPDGFTRPSNEWQLTTSSQYGHEPCNPTVQADKPEEDQHWSVEETQPDIRTRPGEEWRIATPPVHYQEPCNPTVQADIPEEDVHWSVEETQPNIRARPGEEWQIATPPVNYQEPRENMEDLKYSVEEVDTSVIDISKHRNIQAGRSATKSCNSALD